MYDKVKKELLKLELKCLLTRSNDKKRDLSLVINSLNSSLYGKNTCALGTLNKDYFAHFAQFNEWVYSLKDKYIIENYANYYRMLNPFMGVNYYRKRKNNFKVDPKILISIMINFFKSIDNDLYNLFMDYLNKEHLIISDIGQSHNYTVSSAVLQDDYIVVDSLDSVSSMQTIVHEMGHAFYDKVNGCSLDIVGNDLRLKTEIPSQLLEILFLNYLIHNNIYVLEARECLNEFNSRIFVYSDKFRNQDNTFDSLKYAIGILYAKQIYNDYLCGMPFNLKDIYAYLGQNKLENIIRNIKIDYNTIMKEIDYLVLPKVYQYHNRYY